MNTFTNESPAPKIQRPWKLWLSQLGTAWTPIAIITAMFTLTGYFGNIHWLYDISGIFRVQYAILLAAGTIIFWFARRRVLFAISLVALIINLLTIIPLYLPCSANIENKAGSKIVRILQMNVYTPNRQFPRAIAQIKELSPDVVIAEEIDLAWEKALLEGLDDYPFQCTRPRSDNFGIGVFSRLPLREAQIICLGAAGVPSIIATVEAGDSSFRLLATHVLPPTDFEYFAYRNEEFERIAEFLAAEKQPVVLAGDLNCPPWSYYFKKLCRDAKLDDSEKGFGVQPSWPTYTPLFLNPIDHLLMSKNIDVKNRFLAGHIGSDHLPVCVDLVLPPAANSLKN